MADLRSYVLGVAIADNLATPSNDTQAVATFLMNYDGANWDMVRGDATDGLLVNLGANNDVSVAGTVTVDSELPAAAALTDDFANPTVPGVGSFLMLWDSATWDRAPGTSADGLLVNLGANNDVTTSETPPTNPVTNYQTSAAVAAGSAGTLTTPEAASKKLAQVTVWASVAFKAFVHTVDNAVESTDPLAVGGGQAHMAWTWQPHHRDYVALGATAGLDAFRVNVTNLDDTNAADVYATFEYED
jgi:hypothetical protein